MKQETNMAKVVILGAGLTGLSAAYHLEKQGFFDFSIFEKNTTPGGLARSVQTNGFTFDYTGHLLHCNDAYFRKFLDTLLPKNSLSNVRRNSFVYTHNRFIPYPFQMNLNGLPDEVVIECLVGFTKRKHQIKPQNFQEWALKYFGSGIAKHFFIPYNRKILSYDIKKITPSWIGNFIPTMKIKDVLKSVFEKHESEIGYNHIFNYPKAGGIQTFTNAIVSNLIHSVHTNYEVSAIDLKQKIVSFTNGHSEYFETLISTLPLNTFLTLAREPSSLNIKYTRRHLLCNSVINFNLGFKNTDIGNKHWVYVPEKHYPFYRFGFWHNFSPAMTPEKGSSLFGELAYLPETKNKNELQRLTEQSIESTLGILGINRNKIATENILTLPHAYVIYNQWREQNLQNLLNALKEISIHSIGRYGAWKYSSMQDAILDGKHTSEQTIKNIRKNKTQSFWHVNLENVRNETKETLL